jgi:precorrin-6A/cobalt-precorrin-6A reductase
MSFRVLILGGTSEARLLAAALCDDARFDALLSFAGRTESLVRPRSPHRVGGFGGAAGLANFLRAGDFHALIDATHAFAARISHNAAAAARVLRLPFLRVVRPAWQRVEGDVWDEQPDMQAAASGLGSTQRRVFLSVGRLELAVFGSAPQHDYLLRAVEPFVPPASMPRARLIVARGPFALADELELLARERIEGLVSKNAGTPSTYAKIEAARRLAIPVLMVARPPVPPAPEVQTHEAALSWLAARHDESQRGV